MMMIQVLKGGEVALLGPAAEQLAAVRERFVNVNPCNVCFRFARVEPVDAL